MAKLQCGCRIHQIRIELAQCFWAPWVIGKKVRLSFVISDGKSLFIIDHEAGEIMCLVASVCLFVCLWVCSSSPV